MRAAALLLLLLLPPGCIGTDNCESHAVLAYPRLRVCTHVQAQVGMNLAAVLCLSSLLLGTGMDVCVYPHAIQTQNNAKEGVATVAAA